MSYYMESNIIVKKEKQLYFHCNFTAKRTLITHSHHSSSCLTVIIFGKKYLKSRYVTFIKEQIDNHDTYRKNKSYLGESNGRLNFHRYNN